MYIFWSRIYPKSLFLVSLHWEFQTEEFLLAKYQEGSFRIHPFLFPGKEFCFEIQLKSEKVTKKKKKKLP